MAPRQSSWLTDGHVPAYHPRHVWDVAVVSRSASPPERAMTPIVSLASRRYVLQVGDRLVTRAAHPFDPFSNKAVIYFARDAVVSISYTGLAYLESLPTD